MAVSPDDGVSHAGVEWQVLRPMAPLFLAWAVLIGFSVFQDLAGWGDDARIWLLHVDSEQSVYTWFSQLMLAGTAFLLWDTGRKAASTDRRIGRYWTALGGVFLLLSLDEALALHERLIDPLRAALHTSGFLTFAWVIPAVLLCAVGFVAVIPFLRQLPGRVRNPMFLGGALFISGSLAMEMIGGKILSDHGMDPYSKAYGLSVGIEEGLEGLGVLVFLYSVLLYRRDQWIAPLLWQV